MGTDMSIIMVRECSNNMNVVLVFQRARMGVFGIRKGDEGLDAWQGGY